MTGALWRTRGAQISGRTFKHELAVSKELQAEIAVMNRRTAEISGHTSTKHLLSWIEILWTLWRRCLLWLLALVLLSFNIVSS